MSQNSKFSWMKWIAVLAVLGGVGTGVWVWLHPKEARPEYRTIAVERGDITQMVTATGQLNPVVNIQVGSQISGIITNLLVDYNSTVKKDQLIAQLDAGTYQAAVHQAEGDLANAQAGLELAGLSAKRSTELVKANLEPTADDDKARADLRQAEAQVKIKQASLERAQVDLARCTIYAPVDGVVISRNVDVGQTVAASLSAPTIFVIANDLSKMQIDANVSEADVGGVDVDQNVNFTVDAYPYRTFHGKVKQIRNSPVTVQNVVTYDTVIEVNNDDLKLKPGMTANVSIITAQKEGVIRIQNSALRVRPDAGKKSATNAPVMAASSPMGGPGGGQGRGPGGGGGSGGGSKRPRTPMRTVYLLSSTNSAPDALPELKAVQVKTGISDGVFTEVTEGLNVGDPLVTAIIVDASAASAAPASNPFGSGQMRRF